jgi:hypothetical protein
MNMRSEVLTTVSTRITVFWYVTPCSLVDKCQVFEETAASILSTEEWAVYGERGQEPELRAKLGRKNPGWEEIVSSLF